MRTLLVPLMLLLPATAPAQEVYTVDASESRLVVEVGRAGFLKLFGHDHRIRVERFTGEVAWDAEAPERSRFSLDVDAASLVVADEEVSEADRAQIQSDMEAKALDLPGHPRITFTSSSVERSGSGEGVERLKVTGTLALRGVEKRLTVPLEVRVEEGRVVARGEVELESDAWGVPQVSAAGGSVKTSKELGVSFEIVATR